MLQYLSEKYFMLANPDAIKHGEDKIQCKCDICGDSKKNMGKKRLWLYTKEGFNRDIVHCFNCNYSSGIEKYLKDYHNHLYKLYKKEKDESRGSSGGVGVGGYNEILRALGASSNIVSNDKNVNYFKQYTGIGNCKDSEEAKEYLKSRGIGDKNVSKFWYNTSNIVTAPCGKKIHFSGTYIIYPLSNKWNGFWSRSVSEKKFHNYVFNGAKLIKNITDENDYNIYIFEALFDAITSGTKNFYVMNGSSVKLHKRDYKERFIYVYDNDKTGLEQSLKVLGEHHYIAYPWEEYSDVKDINELKVKYRLKNSDIYEIINKKVLSGLTGYFYIKDRLKAMDTLTKG